MKKLLFLVLGLLLMTSSCDETSKPSSDYLVEKTITNSSNEQVVQSGDNLKIIFPDNSISGNLEVKVKKESSTPAMNITNQKAGKNFFKIKFSGDADFLKPVQLILNYDKSSIPVGKTAQESVFGYIYSSGSWKLADYQLDEANEKIIIIISSIFGKINKDKPILLDDGEFIIGDAYTTTDTGQDDEFLTKLQKSKSISVEFAGYHSGLKNGEWSEIRFPLYFNLASEEFTDNITWTGNQFSATLENGGWISGSYNTKAKTINLQAFAEQTKIWSEAAGYDTVNIEANIIFENIPYDFDWLSMFYKFGKDGGGNDVKAMVKKISYIKTTTNINGTKTEEYKSTNYNENAWIEILFMHN